MLISNKKLKIVIFLHEGQCFIQMSQRLVQRSDTISLFFPFDNKTGRIVSKILLVKTKTFVMPPGRN